LLFTWIQYLEFICRW